MRTTPSDRHVELWISTVLRAGVISAAGVVFAGAILYLATHAGEHVTFSHFHGVEAGLDSVHGVIAGVRSGRSEAIVQLGLLILVATPVARVALSLVSFAAERDWLYVTITLIVLGVLMASLFGGIVI
jgi:uncharacterized membrane protein